MDALVTAARTGSHANVQSWLVPGAEHAQSFNTEGTVYVDRVVAFYDAMLGSNTSVSQ